MKLLSVIFVFLLLPSCATYVALALDKKQPDTTEMAKKNGEVEANTEIVGAVITDIKGIASAVRAISKEVDARSSADPAAKHFWGDSDMCVQPQEKICSVNLGCECQ